jgi:DNA (cytosine-5)-methyltransferase 1
MICFWEALPHGRATAPFFRHVAIRRSELYVVGNVPGMKKFPVVMEAMTKLPDYYVHVACPVKSSIWPAKKR